MYLVKIIFLNDNNKEQDIINYSYPDEYTANKIYNKLLNHYRQNRNNINNIKILLIENSKRILKERHILK